MSDKISQLQERTYQHCHRCNFRSQNKFHPFIWIKLSCGAPSAYCITEWYFIHMSQFYKARATQTYLSEPNITHDRRIILRIHRPVSRRSRGSFVYKSQEMGKGETARQAYKTTRVRREIFITVSAFFSASAHGRTLHFHIRWPVISVAYLAIEPFSRVESTWVIGGRATPSGECHQNIELGRSLLRLWRRQSWA